MDDYYQLLNIRRDAPTEEVERRCLELGERSRPDLPGSTAMTQERFDELERAYATLINPEARAEYDAMLIAEEGKFAPQPQELEVDDLPWWMQPKWKRYVLIGSALAGIAILGELFMAIPGVRRPAFDLEGTRPIARQSIDANCSVNGFGRVSCSFTNFGRAKGGTCVQVHLSSIYSTKILDYIVSDAFCSGLIEPSDVRDRTANVAFYNSNGQRTEPHKFCTEGAIKDSWPGQCKLTIVKVSE